MFSSILLEESGPAMGTLLDLQIKHPTIIFQWLIREPFTQDFLKMFVVFCGFIGLCKECQIEWDKFQNKTVPSLSCY